jgi:rhamnulokinase
MPTTHYLACDLGAETGRVVLGTLAKGQLSLREIHRFENKTDTVNGHLCWDLTSLEKELFAGIAKAAQLNLPISGLSAHSWGVDYVLLDGHDRPLQSPACSADGTSMIPSERLLKKLPLATIYAETGIPLLPLHTLFQLESERLADPGLFRKAERFLPIADYLNTRFSGVAACEESLASTTQLYNPQTHAWSPKLFAALDLPGSILPRLVPSGTAFGPVVEELRRHPALVNTRVVATCSHDMAAAIAAIPARAEQRWAFLYSDDWSQFGAELEIPILSCQAREDGFTNEVGLGGSIRFHKNGPGLCLLKECIRSWAASGEKRSMEELSRLAVESGHAKAHLPPADPRFSEPGDMPEKIAAFCRETGQPAPQTPAEFTRTILESLALAHGETLRQLESLTGQEFEVLHIVGRGAENEGLNQLIADATGLPVIAGPPDAAAIGNILIQALALWHLQSPNHLRSIVFSSFPTKIVKPGHGFEKRVREKFRALGERSGLPIPGGM